MHGVSRGAGAGTGARDQIVAEAADAGIQLNFENIERMPNTFDGHRLLHEARAAGCQHALAETLFRAYFEQGLDVGDHRVLQQAAVEAGMSAETAAEILAGDAGGEAVLAQIERAANIGVSGVPCTIFSGTFALPGAQSTDVIASVLERARSR